MKRSVLAVLVWSLAFLLPGCGRSTDERAADLPFLVNLDLSVALSDIAVPESRVSPDAAPANDDEKMQTLRIIVVPARRHGRGQPLCQTLRGPAV